MSIAIIVGSLLATAGSGGCAGLSKTSAAGRNVRPAMRSGEIVTLGSVNDVPVGLIEQPAVNLSTTNPALTDSQSPAAATSEPIINPSASPSETLNPATVVTAGVQYLGNDAAQRLDIYAPSDARNAPVVLFLHGGGWSGGSRADVGAQPKLFNDAGVIFVSIDYRLSPAVRHPDHVDDVAAAVAWVDTNIAKFGGDPTKMILMGHSTGGQLAALAAIDERPLAKMAMRPGAIAGTIVLDGIALDIPETIEKGDAATIENCRQAFGIDPIHQADASPINHVSAGRGIAPFLIICQTDDSLIHAQSERLADRLNTAGTEATLCRIDGKTPSTLAADLGTTNDPAGPVIVEFVKQLAMR